VRALALGRRMEEFERSEYLKGMLRKLRVLVSD
jgi:hypothetical protein